jgi:hypothetical protein
MEKENNQITNFNGLFKKKTVLKRLIIISKE